MATLLSKTQAGGVVGDLYIDASGFHVIDQVYSSGIYRWRKVSSVNPDGDGPEIWSGAVAYEVGDVVAVPQGALWRTLIANGPNANGLHPSVINNWQFIGMLEAQLYSAGFCYFAGMEAIIRPTLMGLAAGSFPDYRVRANVAQTVASAWTLARAANWSLVEQTSVGLWLANYVFMKDMVVSHNGALYRALTTHQSALGSTPDMIPATWEQITAAGVASLPSTLTQTVLAGNEIAVHVNGSNVSTDIFESVTSIAIVGNNLVYTDEAGATTNIDLSLYLDDTNLSRIVSGTLNAVTGILTVTRDDASTFTIDLSGLKDVTSFIGLTDTPSVYSTPGFVTAINPAGNGLVFVDPSTLASVQTFANEAAATTYYTAGGASIPLGAQIYDQSTGTFKIWDGNSWEELALGAATGTLPNGTITGSNLFWSGSSWYEAPPTAKYLPSYPTDAAFEAANASLALGVGLIYLNSATDKVRIRLDTNVWADVGTAGQNLFTNDLAMTASRNHAISNSSEFVISGLPNTAINLQVSNSSGYPSRLLADGGGAAISANEGTANVHRFKAGVGGLEMVTNAPLLLNNATGTNNQVLTSRGAGQAPVWANAGGGSVVATALYPATSDSAYVTYLTSIGQGQNGGAIYWNTGSKIPRIYDGVQWRTISLA